MQSKITLAKEYIKQLNAKPSIISNIVIGIIGLPGSGKSTIAAKLAERTGLLVVSNDNVRRFLNAHGYPGASPEQETLEFISNERTEYLLRNGISHIIDADLTGHIDGARSRAQKYGFKLVLIKVGCPEEIILDRITKRLIEGKSESQADIEKYHSRVKFQNNHASEQHDFLAIIDTSRDINTQIDRLSHDLLG